jgi:hypothetical protein
VERVVRTPCLVDHQRHAACMAELREARDVGSDAVIGRADNKDCLGVGMRVQLGGELGARGAVAHVPTSVVAGLEEDGLHSGEDESADQRETSTVSPGFAAARTATWLDRVDPAVEK